MTVAALKRDQWCYDDAMQAIAEGNGDDQDLIALAMEEALQRIEAAERKVERAERTIEQAEEERRQAEAFMARLADAEQRYHETGEIDEDLLPTGDAQARANKREHDRSIMESAKEAFEDKHALDVERAACRDERVEMVVSVDAPVMPLDEFRQRMRDLIAAIARAKKALSSEARQACIRLIPRIGKFVVALRRIGIEVDVHMPALERQDE